MSTQMFDYVLTDGWKPETVYVHACLALGLSYQSDWKKVLLAQATIGI